MPEELDLIRDLYRYNATGRKGYLRKIWSLPTKERYRARGASFPSMVDIYMHILDAYRYWFILVYQKRTFEEYPLGQRFSRLAAARETAKVDRMLNCILASLRPRDLDREFSRPGEKGRKITLRDMLVHMVEEELQHKGELNALLWQLDVDAPVHAF